MLAMSALRPAGSSGPDALWPLCLLLLALLHTPLCLAGKYAYGEQIVRVGKSWPDAAPPRLEAADATADLMPGAGAYWQQLDALEDEGGPYSDGLAEPLVSLGRYHRDNGDLQQAMLLYRRALHVVRINDGLYSERQAPILQAILETYRVSGDLQALDDRYDYYFRLYGNGKPPYTDLRLRATLAYLRWQREALRLEIDKQADGRLFDLYQLNKDLLDSVSADPAVSLVFYRELVFSQLRNLYILEDRYAPTVENMGVAPPLPIISNEWNQEDFTRRRMETIQRMALSQGVGLLEDLIERSAAAGETAELARAHLELGDWYQWHGKQDRSAEQYRQVVQLLQAGNLPDLLEQWLGQPVELPDNGAFWQPASVPGPKPRAVVTARYEVSRRGRVRNLQTEVAGGSDSRLAARVKRKLSHIRFRPRWVAGAAEAVSAVQRDYELINP